MQKVRGNKKGFLPESSYKAPAEISWLKCREQKEEQAVGHSYNK